MKNIILIGMMGCGKTTIAQILGEKLERPFLDLDAYIEAHYGSIESLFLKGQDHFRDIESKAVAEVSLLESHVISTGGGVVLRKENITNLKSNGILFFLERPITQILETIDTSNRPLLKDGPQVLFELYQKRLPFYISSSDYMVDASLGIEKTVESFMEILKNIGLS